MRAHLALATIVATVAASPVWAQTPDVAALQRSVFGLRPALPDTPKSMEAQLRLAQAYASGTGIAQDVEMGCGLAQVVRIQSLILGDDHPTHLRAIAVTDAICANPRDLGRSLSRASCAHFGVIPDTLDDGLGTWLTITSDGWTVENASGLHEGEWAINCFDVVASVRLVRVNPPPGSPHRARQFIELLVWHQSYRDDGTTGPRSLEWYADELRPERHDINRLASDTLVQQKGELIWPTPPVPHGGRWRRQIPHAAERRRAMVVRACAGARHRGDHGHSPMTGVVATARLLTLISPRFEPRETVRRPN